MSKFLLIFLIFNYIVPAFCLDLPVSRIPDDSHLRLRLSESWMIETPASVLSLRSRIEYLENGDRVQVNAREGTEEFRVYLSREQMSGADRRATGSFPGWAQGSWMLTRRKDTGAPTSIRIYLRSDQNTYIQFRPFAADKSHLDAVIYGAYITRSIPVPVPFERLYTMQLNDIFRLVQDKFPMRYFEPDAAVYRDSRRFIGQVRPHLRNLRFANDGAVDENGNFVFIETLQRQNIQGAGLNCSGFVKWLIDGLLHPITGGLLPITPLKQPFGQRGSSFTELWEENRDVFFGLDWVRNLAAEANETMRSPAFRAIEEFEVRSDNFSLIMVNQNNAFVTQTFPGFMREAGYGIEGLRPLLYTLAIDDPFSFYLAAVSNEIAAPDSPRGTPRLRQYYHTAALVPYFDELGNFRIVVFESGEETAFSAFRARYPEHHVNLVRIPFSQRFDPGGTGVIFINTLQR